MVVELNPMGSCGRRKPRVQRALEAQSGESGLTVEQHRVRLGHRERGPRTVDPQGEAAPDLAAFTPRPRRDYPAACRT